MTTAQLQMATAIEVEEGQTIYVQSKSFFFGNWQIRDISAFFLCVQQHPALSVDLFTLL